ncbi:hypothetical protein PIB30_016940 [Stylosanthes scabra]|uniref:Uncharacterized protein n=1 Tax=Stylosanthes scabra TaxID=79078 RepID=A0ABU6X7F5_9FABA|nr:hypothetical protein [Stylosanthes scabra]
MGKKKSCQEVIVPRPLDATETRLYGWVEKAVLTQQSVVESDALPKFHRSYLLMEDSGAEGDYMLEAAGLSDRVPFRADEEGCLLFSFAVGFPPTTDGFHVRERESATPSSSSDCNFYVPSLSLKELSQGGLQLLNGLIRGDDSFSGVGCEMFSLSLLTPVFTIFCFGGLAFRLVTRF